MKLVRFGRSKSCLEKKSISMRRQLGINLYLWLTIYTSRHVKAPNPHYRRQQIH